MLVQTMSQTCDFCCMLLQALSQTCDFFSNADAFTNFPQVIWNESDAPSNPINTDAEVQNILDFWRMG